ncbi:hypothetical protein E7681_00200 [Thalassobius vesicularis]|uniref:Uncharacterized protein n=1 Tax=Thalassobius vesicularis TaxID=1294297 RepID=A0A4S3MDW0_9RHOB|nr:hypothetical protein E7681_00200 [Thalassobius vesicularis]
MSELLYHGEFIREKAVNGKSRPPVFSAKMPRKMGVGRQRARRERGVGERRPDDGQACCLLAVFIRAGRTFSQAFQFNKFQTSRIFFTNISNRSETFTNSIAFFRLPLCEQNRPGRSAAKSRG